MTITEKAYLFVAQSCNKNFCNDDHKEQTNKLIDLIQTEIQSAILAEREVCARIALGYGQFKETQASEKGNWLHDDGIYEWSGQEIASQIRARSNPETPNKVPESPKIEYEGQDIPYSKLIAPDPISA